MISFVTDNWDWLVWAVPLLVLACVVAWMTRDWRLALGAVAGIAAALKAGSIYAAGRKAERERLEEANRAAAAKRADVDHAARGKTRADMDRDFDRWGKLVLLLGLLIVGACASAPAGGGAGGSFCETAKPIRLSVAARAGIADAELRRVWAHNDFGERQCGARWIAQGDGS
jgi:hypothetical protein